MKMVLKKFLVMAAIIFMAQVKLQASTAYDPYYTAGVVEFRPSAKLTADERLQDSLQDYLKIINSTEAKDLDIIVFPESTLNSNAQATFVPNPAKEKVVPCDVSTGEYHSLLQQLSCAARNQKVYLVINLSEKERCSSVPEDTRPCAANGLNIFNTNVVFDRSGAVISRYRKVHLYGENKNTTFVPEYGWFDTDFGVRFGHFICFDILFYAPAQAMADRQGIKDFIFPSMWFSQLPFLVSVQVHQAWSYANNVNLLAAGSSNPTVGSTGTGIYNGRQGIQVVTMNLAGIGERKLYKAQVRKFRHLEKRSLAEIDDNKAKLIMPKIVLKRDYLENYKTYAIDLFNSTKLKHEMCFTNSTFCCKFELKWQPLKLNASTGKYYHYRLGVYDAVRSEAASETNELKNCALFSCIGSDIKDCGKQLQTEIEEEVVFENITITGVYPQAKEYLLMPNSLTNDLKPVPVQHFKWEESFTTNNVQVRYELNTTTANIMAFSIYGNYYDSHIEITPDEAKDDNGGNGDGAATIKLSCLLFIMAIFLINIHLL